jgi:hypothetical protein
LRAFLETGKSTTYTEEILGRWDFDVAGTMSLIRRAHPNLTAIEIQKSRAYFAADYTMTSFVAAPVDLAVLKNLPHINRGPPSTIELQNCTGQWSDTGGKYSVTLSVSGKDQQLTGEIRGDRLSLSSPEMNLAFIRED